MNLDLNSVLNVQKVCSWSVKMVSDIVEDIVKKVSTVMSEVESVRNVLLLVILAYRFVVLI